jgi:hypothetical protein
MSEDDGVMASEDAPTARPVSLSPEHDWSAGAPLVRPLLRPSSTTGLTAEGLTPAALTEMTQSHTQPIVDRGPAGLAVVYALEAHGFDIVVNGEHLLSWGVPASEVRAAAMRNLAAWSADTDWSLEVSGDRRLVSSAHAAGSDAARILLPEVIAHLEAELGGRGRIVVGLPERHLLVAGTLSAGDAEFGPLFAGFLEGQYEAADEPIDPRVLELSGGELVAFAP